MTDARVAFQRSFYDLLLRMEEGHEDLPAILHEALELISGACDASQGYLEICDADGARVFQSFSIDDSDIAGLQQTISTGIIAEAIRTRETILIPSALVDPRFETRESVQRMQIESVLCLPFFGSRTSGILYLQGDPHFESQARTIVLDTKLFARHVSPLLDTLLSERERLMDDDEFGTLRTRHDLDGIIGQSAALGRVISAAMMVAPLDVTTLLLGETGTGKTSLAHAIHRNSQRRDAPFVEINCAALPDTLIENELFGAVPGAHSSATRHVPGKLSAADTGTLFLDEICELPLESQAKLLQFLQSGQYYPLGSTRLESADVRLICATNRDIVAEVEAGRFREDLYYRVNSFILQVPTLSERKSDIALLVEHMVEACCKRHNFPPLRVSSQVIETLSRRQWRGNLRELNSVIERACINARMHGQDEISVDDESATDETGAARGET
ncbi:MAG: sigma 54-interacting transcriptional regulator, partial [Pseudomonadales bacterium]|nr:sigma 54-interacting transcriptional regulator [Pseudomonadales bacterium]